MNTIDKDFNELAGVIKNKSLEEVFNDIKDAFFKIPLETQKSLEDYYANFGYWGKLKRSDEEYEELYNRAKSLKEHIDDYVFIYDKLSDYRSKKLLYAILSNWYRFDFVTIASSLEKNYAQYLDLDILKPSSDEVIVDLGAYTGDTMINYINTFGEDCYKKIYCYEITKETFEVLKGNLRKYENIEFVNKAASDNEGVLYINENETGASANTIEETGTKEVLATTIDNDIKNQVTLIKMDIEGSEQKALKGCEKHIKNEHPKLLISVYHNHEDLYKIPLMINDMDPSYKFYLRCYGSIIFPTEIVLFAI